MNPLPLPVVTPGSENPLPCQWTDQCPWSGLAPHNSTRQTVADGDDFHLSERYPLCFRQKQAPSLIGIPTVNGMEFLKPKEIIRCEGMQRLTKVFTAGGTIISSYNIGEFCKLLCPSGFFSPHKSHLINLHYLRSYCHDGIITLRTGARIPLARRRRDAFLMLVRHL